MNYKQTIIKAFNSEIAKRGLQDIVVQAGKKAEWTYKKKYWTNLITASMDKYKTRYWIDLTTCFRWTYQMTIVSLDWSIINLKRPIDRFVIEISDSMTEQKIQDMASDIIDKLMKHAAINTPEKILKVIYFGKVAEVNVWENFHKAMLYYVCHRYKKGRYYLERARDCKYQYDISILGMQPYLELLDDPEAMVKKIEEICQENIDKV